MVVTITFKKVKHENIFQDKYVKSFLANLSLFRIKDDLDYTESMWKIIMNCMTKAKDKAEEDGRLKWEVINITNKTLFKEVRTNITKITGSKAMEKDEFNDCLDFINLSSKIGKQLRDAGIYVEVKYEDNNKLKKNRGIIKCQ